MIRIRYNNNNTFEEVTFHRNGNLITLTPTTQNTSGFKTFRMSGEQLGDFSNFTTVFRVENNSITYSNDGSVYKEIPQPTEEELKRKDLQSEKTELEQWLKDHDYIGTKIATGRGTIEEYANIIADMNVKANRINEINELLKLAY